MKITEIFEAVQNTAGTNDKKRILKDNINTTIKWVFDDCYGKRKYYIKTFEPNGIVGYNTIDNDYIDFHNALDRLAKREITGDAAYAYLQEVVSKYTADDQAVLCKIIDRNLKIGISLDNFLDIIGKKSEKYEVALAESFSKAKGIDPTDGTYLISQKLDGVRCNCFITREEHNGEIETTIEFKSRQGKALLTLDRMKVDVNIFTQGLGCGEFVLDGEVCIIDENGKENFQGLMKEITRKDHTIEHPKYKVFDILTVDEFWGRAESPIFSERYDKLCELTRNYNYHIDPRLQACADAYTYIDLVIQQRVTSQEILDAWIELARKEEWEGCMLRKDVPYKRGRSKDLLKIKDMQDAEYEVIGLETGTATYNEGGHKEFKVVSALKIVHKGHIVSVGSGLSKEQRLRWYEHPEEILGEIVTIQYFEETKDSKTNTYSLRFPVLKHVYEGGRNV